MGDGGAGGGVGGVGVGARPLFAGLVFVLNSDAMDRAAADAVEEHGGRIDRNPSRAMTHLVCARMHYPALGFRAETALRHGARLVSEQWVRDSAAAGKLLPLDGPLARPYAVSVGGVPAPAPAPARAPTDTPATEARANDAEVGADADADADADAHAASKHASHTAHAPLARARSSFVLDARDDEDLVAGRPPAPPRAPARAPAGEAASSSSSSFAAAPASTSAADAAGARAAPSRAHVSAPVPAPPVHVPPKITNWFRPAAAAASSVDSAAAVPVSRKRPRCVAAAPDASPLAPTPPAAAAPTAAAPARRSMFSAPSASTPTPHAAAPASALRSAESAGSARRPVVAAAAPAGGALPVAHSGGLRTYRWFWRNDSGGWVEYPAGMAARLDQGLAERRARIEVDAERYVDLERMCQRRKDDPRKVRELYREPRSPLPARRGAPAPAAPAARAVAPARAARAPARSRLEPGHQTVNHRWLWMTESGWRPFRTRVSDALEAAFLLRERDTVPIDAERFVDLRAMVQRRFDDRHRMRAVKRVECPDPLDRVGGWFWLADDGWRPYGADLSDAMEAAFARGERTFRVDAERYVDFHAWLQRRIDDGERARYVKRRGGPTAPLLASRLTPEQQERAERHRLIALRRLRRTHEVHGGIHDDAACAGAASGSAAAADPAAVPPGAAAAAPVAAVPGDDDDGGGATQPDDLSWLRRSARSRSPSPPSSESETETEEDLAAFDASAPSFERRRRLYRCGADFVTLAEIPPLSAAYSRLTGAAREAALATSSPHVPRSDINAKVALWHGDITRLELDAVVNAAKPDLTGGGGVDGLIHAAAGPALLAECLLLGGCDPGEARITGGHRLPARFVLHAVGPIGEDRPTLERAYKSCLALVRENALRSVAFCGISTGVYGYPVRAAAHVALGTVREWLEDDANLRAVQLVVFLTFTDEERAVYDALAPRYFPL